jgi:hypothetical protein
LPRAFVVSAQKVVASAHRQLLAVEDPGFQRRTVAVTDHTVTGVSTSQSPIAQPAGSASITSYAPEEVRIRVHADRQSLLVLTDQYFPGWSATVDGHRAAIARVDYLLRGVPVGRGSSTVIFRYSPASWNTGWIVSVVALGGWIAILIAGIARRRTSANGPPAVAP